MPTVHIKGRVLPSVVKVTIKDLPSLQWKDTENSQTLNIITRILDSEIDIEFGLDVYDDSVRDDLFKRAWDLARASVDMYSYTTGWGLSVYLDTLVEPDGTESVFVPKNESLAQYSTAFDISPGNLGTNNFDALYRLVLSEPPLFMAFNDLIVSITLPHHATVNCGRAIEAIRFLMIPTGIDRTQGWPIMRANLNVDQNYLKFITNVSNGPRHGDRAFIPCTVVNETVKRSWIIMNRFLEYRKRGNQALPLADFPLLT